MLLIEEIIEYNCGYLVNCTIILLNVFFSKNNSVVGSSVGITVAGSTSNPGVWSYQFNNPSAITFDQYGYMYVLDYSNSRVQKWYPGASYGVTVAASAMYNPYGLKFDRQSNIVIADTYYHRVISFALICCKFQ